MPPLSPQTTWHNQLAGVASKVIVDPAKYAEYVLVWNLDTPPRGAALTFVNFVRDYLKDAKHSENDIPVPESADLL